MKINALTILLPALAVIVANAAMADVIAEESFDYSTYGNFSSSLDGQGGRENGWKDAWSGDEWFFDVADPTHGDNPNDLREVSMQVGDIDGGNRLALLSGDQYGDHYDMTRKLNSSVQDDNVYIRFLFRWDWGEMSDGDMAYFSFARKGDDFSVGLNVNGDGEKDFFIQLGDETAYVDLDLADDPYADYAFEIHLSKDGSGDYSDVSLEMFKGEDAAFVGSAELSGVDSGLSKIDKVRMETENLLYDSGGGNSDYVFMDELVIADSYSDITVGGNYGDAGVVSEPTSTMLILAAGATLFLTTKLLRRKAGSDADQD